MTSDTSACMHVPLLELLYLTCLKTLPSAGGFAMIGCRLSRGRILTFASLTESTNLIFRPSISALVLTDDSMDGPGRSKGPFSNERMKMQWSDVIGMFQVSILISSLFLYFNHLVSFIAGGSESP